MTLQAAQPIGIFDSGIGGLTVANAISHLLPNESIIYFGDTAHLPYGEKSTEAIQQYSIRIADFLVEQGCKMIVIACNTASSAAYDILKTKYAGQLEVIDVVNPIVKGILAHDELKKIGIIGTKATIKSGIYEQKIKAEKPGLQVLSKATPLFVPVIEEGFTNTAISKATVERYLEEKAFEDIDGIILACTHYPLLKNDIAYFYRHRIQIFDSTDFVANAVKESLNRQGLLQENAAATHHFYVSDYTEVFEKTTRIFYGENIRLEKYDLWS